MRKAQLKVKVHSIYLFWVPFVKSCRFNLLEKKSWWMCISMAAHSAGSLEEVFDNPLIFQTPTAERHSLLIVGFDNFMGIVVKYYCFWRQYALNKTHQCMYCLFMTIRCKTLSAPMITFISSPPENQDQWKYCLLDKLRYFQVKVKVTFLWLEIVHYLKWIKQEM